MHRSVLPRLGAGFEQRIVIALEQIKELVLEAPLHGVEVPGSLRLRSALLGRRLGTGGERSQQDDRRDATYHSSSHGPLLVQERIIVAMPLEPAFLSGQSCGFDSVRDA